MLNPELYNKLMQLTGGQVRIHRENEPFIYHFDCLNNLVRDDGGEHYSICCPQCGDKYFRLYINHRYGTLEDITSRVMWHVAHCFNEECPTDWLKWWFLGCGIKHFRLPELPEGKAKTVILETPGSCVPLVSLPMDHCAVDFVVNRGVDPVWLSSNFDVRFCYSSPNPLVCNRLVFMVNDETGYRGFQARTLTNSEPKYYTAKGMLKSQLLLNRERAFNSGIAILTEGPFDAVACGQHGVCTFGASLSEYQAQLLGSAFRYNGTVIVAYDWDTTLHKKKGKNPTEKALEKLSQIISNLKVIQLPENMDPGDLGFGGMKELVKAQLNLDLRY